VLPKLPLGNAITGEREIGRWLVLLMTTRRNTLNILRKNNSVIIKREDVGWILMVTLVAGIILGLHNAPKSVNYPADAVVENRKVGATYAEKRENRAMARLYAKVGFGYSKREVACLINLWDMESKFDNYARPRSATGKLRSSALGIAQHLGETSVDSATQILRGLRYIEKHRIYKGSACRALQFHRLRGWY